MLLENRLSLSILELVPVEMHCVSLYSACFAYKIVSVYTCRVFYTKCWVWLKMLFVWDMGHTQKIKGRWGTIYLLSYLHGRVWLYPCLSHWQKSKNGKWNQTFWRMPYSERIFHVGVTLAYPGCKIFNPHNTSRVVFVANINRYGLHYVTDLHIYPKKVSHVSQQGIEK